MAKPVAMNVVAFLTAGASFKSMKSEGNGGDARRYASHQDCRRNQ
jgi:hypothetical protein